MNNRTAAQVFLFFFIGVCARAPAQSFFSTLDIPFDTIPSIDSRFLSLDLYQPVLDTGRCPVVVYVHGGGWTSGDKSDIAFQPDFFCSHGFLFLSVNYRLLPDSGTTLRHPMQVQDVASAIAWTFRNIKNFHGDTNNLFLMGHSAGAHLVSLAATNQRFLTSQGLSLQNLRAVAPLDPAGVDILRENIGYTVIFGADSTSRIDASPALNCAPGKNIPPFMILHNMIDSAMQARATELADSLKSAQIEVHLLPIPGKDHSALNHDFGNPDDTIGMQEADSVLNFFKQHLFPSNQIKNGHIVSTHEHSGSRLKMEKPFTLSGRFYQKKKYGIAQKSTTRIFSK
jgi:arylformamidase